MTCDEIRDLQREMQMPRKNCPPISHLKTYCFSSRKRLRFDEFPQASFHLFGLLKSLANGQYSHSSLSDLPKNEGFFTPFVSTRGATTRHFTRGHATDTDLLICVANLLTRFDISKEKCVAASSRS